MKSSELSHGLVSTVQIQAVVNVMETQNFIAAKFM